MGTVFDTGDNQEGMASPLSLNPVLTAHDFQESGAHDRNRTPIYPNVKISGSIGYIDSLGNITPAPGLLPYVFPPSNCDWSFIEAVDQPGAPTPQYSNGKQGWAAMASQTGMMIFETDGYYNASGPVAIFPELAKMLISGPNSGCVTTNVYDFGANSLSAPSATTSLSLATSADSQNFIIPTGATGTTYNVMIWWPTTPAASLPTFPISNPFGGGQFVVFPLP